MQARLADPRVPPRGLLPPAVWPVAGTTSTGPTCAVRTLASAPPLSSPRQTRSRCSTCSPTARWPASSTAPTAASVCTEGGRGGGDWCAPPPAPRLAAIDEEIVSKVYSDGHVSMSREQPTMPRQTRLYSYSIAPRAEGQGEGGRASVARPASLSPLSEHGN